MNGESNEFFMSSVKNQEQAFGLMERLLAVAQSSAVFGQPVTSGEYTIITASEVSAGLGFGFGMGGGSGPAPTPGKPTAEGEAVAEDGETSGKAAEASGGGGGGGGGGGAMSRPVAVISVGPNGVRVEPVVDATKISLAFFTMLGSMFVMARKMRRGH